MSHQVIANYSRTPENIHIFCMHFKRLGKLTCLFQDIKYTKK